MRVMTAMPTGRVLLPTLERNQYANILKSHKIFWYCHKNELIYIYGNNLLAKSYHQ